jgi:hypothetical protein
MGFNTMKGFVIMIFLVVISLFVYKGYMITSMTKDGKHLYEISIPGNKRQETSLYTNSYVEKDGCVTFKDEFGRSHRICGMYNITEY